MDVVGFGMTFRALAVMVAIVALAATDPQLALAATLLYALAYTLELAVSLALYFGGGARRRPSETALGARSAVAARSALALPSLALGAREEEEFDPSHEWELKEWIPIHIGPLDLSINKAVAYLILGTDLHDRPRALPDARARRLEERGRAAPGGRGDRLRHRADADRRARASRTRRSRAGSRTWPRSSSSSGRSTCSASSRCRSRTRRSTVFGVELPTLAIFAATSTLSVTIALALLTFIFTHVEGIRYNGPVKYFKSWIPDVPKGLYPLIVPLEILGQFMRLISLSVRLYANMLAGHMLILTFIGLIFLTSPWIVPVSVLFGSLFYIFEVVIVVSIQAFIFAALSAIYIGSAIEPEH